MSLRLERLRRIVGIELPADQVLVTFMRLGLRPQRRGEQIDVTIPEHRMDIVAEIDLVEEACAASRILSTSHPSRNFHSPGPTRSRIHDNFHNLGPVLAAAGYFEAITFSFVSDALRSDLRVDACAPISSVRKADAALRPSLIPGLLEAVRFNESNGTADAKLFEIVGDLRSRWC